MKVKNDKLVIQIICALIAVGLWVIAMLNNNPIGEKVIRKIPVAINNLDALTSGNSNYMLMEDLENLSVSVTVKGMYNDLLDIGTKDIKATASISSFKEGLNTAEVEIDVPNDVEFKSVSPKYITFNVEPIVSVSVDVSVQYEGEQAEGYYLERYGSANPETIFVKGPRNIVNSVNSAVVVVNIDKSESKVVQKKPVKLYDNTNQEIDTKFLTISPSSVEAGYDILPTKNVVVEPTIIGEPAQGYKVKEIIADLSTVEIAAKADILKLINNLETEALDISGAMGDVSGEKRIILEKGICLTGEKDKVKLTAVVEEVVEKTFDYSFENITYMNKESNMTITPIDENQTIKVKLRGVKSIIEDLKKENVSLIVDLLNSENGKNTFKLNLIANVDDVEIVCDTENIDLNVEFSQDVENSGTISTENN